MCSSLDQATKMREKFTQLPRGHGEFPHKCVRIPKASSMCLKSNACMVDHEWFELNSKRSTVARAKQKELCHCISVWAVKEHQAHLITFSIRPSLKKLDSTYYRWPMLQPLISLDLVLEDSRRIDQLKKQVWWSLVMLWWCPFSFASAMGVASRGRQTMQPTEFGALLCIVA